MDIRLSSPRLTGSMIVIKTTLTTVLPWPCIGNIAGTTTQYGKTDIKSSQ